MAYRAELISMDTEVDADLGWQCRDCDHPTTQTNADPGGVESHKSTRTGQQCTGVGKEPIYVVKTFTVLNPLADQHRDTTR